MSKQLVETVNVFNAIIERAMYQRDPLHKEMTFEEWQKKHSTFVHERTQEVL